MTECDPSSFHCTRKYVSEITNKIANKDSIPFSRQRFAKNQVRLVKQVYLHTGRRPVYESSRCRLLYYSSLHLENLC